MGKSTRRRDVCVWVNVGEERVKQEGRKKGCSYTIHSNYFWGRLEFVCNKENKNRRIEEVRI
jgi:hypothetical protein